MRLSINRKYQDGKIMRKLILSTLLTACTLTAHASEEEFPTKNGTTKVSSDHLALIQTSIIPKKQESKFSSHGEALQESPSYVTKSYKV